MRLLKYDAGEKRKSLVAACADYLIGKKTLKAILHDHGVPGPTVCFHVRRAGFKLRNRTVTNFKTLKNMERKRGY